ncbi:DUF3368 domain-containing protein [Nostoc flagelliforme]|uniref:DUF3368 domain-containing protein n=1 Tax=Nostoc flagelliforme TaxID=1306274 RepID=UPI001F5556BD|nr:DUF3368 domain-containing protein [Nostoc flagelliforme]
MTWGYANPGTEVILDDLVARRCAATLSIPVRGTLGIMITAKQRGVIPAARPVLEQLRLCGMYLSDRVINQALTSRHQSEEESTQKLAIASGMVNEV